VIRALRDSDGELPVRVRWIVEGEEEIGSTNFDAIVRTNAELLRADGALWEGGAARLPDGRPELGLGFKGALGVRLDVKTLATDAHSALEAIAPSAAWSLVQALASIRDRDGTVQIRGFYDSVLPATDEERQAIAAASFSDEDELRETLGLDAFVDGLSGAALWERASLRPTSNLAGVDRGYSGPGIKTVLPAAASAWMDFRLVPDQAPDEILELLRAHLDREGFGGHPGDSHRDCQACEDPARRSLRPPCRRRRRSRQRRARLGLAANPVHAPDRRFSPRPSRGAGARRAR
jgi:acetylornithine deacetylase/succinyl-diaminopimelate desuccinylase-like protein